MFLESQEVGLRVTCAIISEMSHPDHVIKNRAAWTGFNHSFVEPGRRAWAKQDIDWGIWSVPEAQIGALAGIQLAAKDTIELGCGTAYFSAWLAKLGAKPTGIDITPAQLATAAEFQREFGIAFPLIEGNAEDTGLASESFDFALSEYGASIWCDPERWIPEAARLLRQGGHLVFLRNGTLSMACTPAFGPVQTSLQRDWHSVRRIEWDDDKSVEFHLPPSELIRLLRLSGFEIEALIDVWPPPNAAPTNYEYMTLDWAERWPSEEIWRARKK